MTIKIKLYGWMLFCFLILIHLWLPKKIYRFDSQALDNIFNNLIEENCEADTNKMAF